MRPARRILIPFLTIAAFLAQWPEVSAQESAKDRRAARRAKNEIVRPDPATQRFNVQGGIKQQIAAPDSLSTALSDSLQGISPADTLEGSVLIDSLTGAIIAPANQFPDSLGGGIATLPDSLALTLPDSLQAVAPLDSAALDSLARAQMPRRELRKLQRDERKLDSTLTHSYLFRDSIPISRLSALSIVVPGLSQIYNKQAWKVPILYGTVAAGIYFGSRQSKSYKFYKQQYDNLIAVMPSPPSSGPSYDPEEFARWRRATDPIQEKMIKHNTARQILLGGALASYIYFIGDGAVNYPGQLTDVKKATTLSTICPGAGQVYNKSFWKVPIVVGGIATFAYVIDWNNRGYQRFKLAYDQVIQAEKNGTERIDEFRNYANLGAKQIKDYKDSYRRNRDFCIILAAGFYLLNIVDAHVDAHLKDYDISSDLSYTFGPSVSNFHLASSGVTRNLYGVSFKMNF